MSALSLLRWKGNRQDENGEKYLIEKCGCGLYEVRSEIVCT